MMSGCSHGMLDEGQKHRWGHRWQGGSERWKVIKEGIKIDVDTGKQKGEKTPEEFWSRVWQEMRKDTPNTPDITSDSTKLEVPVAREQDTPSPATLMEELPRPVTWMVLMRRWEEIGKGVEPDKASIEAWDEIKSFHKKHLNKEAKAKLEEMAKSGTEDEFWREHWNERAKSTAHHRAHGDHRHWWYSPNNNNSKGDMPGCRGRGGMHGYGDKYPFGYDPESSEFMPRGYCRFSRWGRRSADEKPFFKEFDFCS